MAGKSNLVVGLDLGTNCGFAVLDGQKRLKSGTWHLWHPRKDRFNRPWNRWTRFQTALDRLLVQVDFWHNSADQFIVGFEDVHRHTGTRAAHVYGALRAMTEMIEVNYNALVVPISVSAWKRAACGKGNADKAAYIAAMNKRFKMRMDKKREDEAAALGVAEACRLMFEEN